MLFNHLLQIMIMMIVDQLDKLDKIVLRHPFVKDTVIPEQIEIIRHLIMKDIKDLGVLDVTTRMNTDIATMTMTGVIVL